MAVKKIRTASREERVMGLITPPLLAADVPSCMGVRRRRKACDGLEKSRFLGCRRVRSGCARNDKVWERWNESAGTLSVRWVSDVEDARVADRSELRWHLQWEAEVRADHRLMSRH